MPVDDLEVAIKAAIRASEIIAESYGNFKQLDFKSDIDVVTEVVPLNPDALPQSATTACPTPTSRAEAPRFKKASPYFPVEKIKLINNSNIEKNFILLWPLCQY